MQNLFLKNITKVFHNLKTCMSKKLTKSVVFSPHSLMTADFYLLLRFKLFKIGD